MLDALRWLWQPDGIIAFQRVFGPGWRPVFELFSLLGGHQLAVLAIAWARWFHGRRLAGRLLVAVLLGLAIDMLIWDLFPTARPDDPRIRVATQIPFSSFPSGHMVTALTVWGTLAAARLLPRRAVAALVLLVALGRLGLGQHYPRDLLGGLAIGLLILGGVAWAWPRLLAAVGRLTPAQRVTTGAAMAALVLAATLVVPAARWDLLGLLIGVALALPLEARWVGYAPAPLPPRLRLAQAALGCAGIAAYLGASRFARDIPLLHNLLLSILLALWILLAVPVLFRRLGWSAIAPPSDPGEALARIGVSSR